MGLNIAGIIIDKNYENDISKLESILGNKLQIQKNILFEEAYESFKEDTYCDIYFSQKGTFVFCAMEKAAFEFYADTQNVLSFVLSEMTMTFSLQYVKNGKLSRTIFEAEGEIQENEGTPLAIEKTIEDTDELIYHLIEKTLGASFYEIEPDATCKRYILKPLVSQKTAPNSHQKKPWWKFW